ncbi:MAG: thiamine phosphate synthase [Parvularculaceae bacterium]
MRRHEGLRVRAAKLAAAGRMLKARSGAIAPFSLAFMTDAARAPDPLLIARVMHAGGAIVLRDYRHPKRAALAAQLQSICARRGLKLIVGADIALAQTLGAAGVHLPRWFSPTTPIPKGMIVTASCHDAAELDEAKEKGAQAAFLSPAFATQSHPDARALGAARFKQLAAASPLPVIALGGADEANAPQLCGPNVAGLAAIGAFLS